MASAARARRGFGVIGGRLPGAPQKGHDRIADIFVDGAPLRVDFLADQAEMPVEESGKAPPANGRVAMRENPAMSVNMTLTFALFRLEPARIRRFAQQTAD